MKNIAKHDRLRGLSLTIVVTVLLQCGGAVWWVSAQARDGYFMERRVTEMEGALAKTTEGAGALNERLARIEERLAAQAVLLGRIEKNIALLGKE